MFYGKIKSCDIADGVGVRVTLFVSGCTHHCRGCFQPEAWAFDYGEPFTDAVQDQIITLLSPGYISGLTLLGGEPMEPDNQRALLPFIRRVKEAYPEKTIWCYTGYTLEKNLLSKSDARCEVTDELLDCIDVLVDGEYMEEKRNIMLQFRGSENQRLIDLKCTKKTGILTLLPENAKGLKNEQG